MLDLTRLMPAPWHFAELPGGNDVIAANGLSVLWNTYDVDENDGKFIALARNAFDGDPEALAWWEANRRKR